MKRVIIIGCGYAGYTLAQALDASADVVVVEPRDAFVHNVAAIMSVTDPALLDRIILPYGKLLKRGKVLRDSVTSIEAQGVKLASGGTLEGDVIVIATGSGYARPFKPETDQASDFADMNRAAHEQVRAEKSIAIVGAGTVGTELAGEIDPQLEARARRRQLPLPLLPVERIEDRRPRLPRRLVDLRDHQLEPDPRDLWQWNLRRGR